MQPWEMKAEPLTNRQMDRWLAGEISRRHLALPFGGPIPSPSSAKGVDADLEFFDETTDFYGDYPALRATRERLVDWHHVTFGDRKDPTGLSKGVVMGRVILDDEPSDGEADDGDEYAGVWSDLWLRAGQRQQAMIRSLARRGAALYGSSQPVQSGIRTDAKTGHIEVWPVRYHTITTAPQNTHAVMGAMKAGDLLADSNLADLSVGALRAFLTGLDDPVPDPSVIAATVDAQREREAKAGRVLSAVNEADIQAALESFEQALEALNSVLRRHRKDPT